MKTKVTYVDGTEENYDTGPWEPEIKDMIVELSISDGSPYNRCINTKYIPILRIKEMTVY